MEVFEAIKSRRSVRKFRNDPIPQETIEKLLEAATLAPTGGNKQPWEFIIVNRTVLDQFQEKLDQAYESRAKAVSEDALNKHIKDIYFPEGNENKAEGMRRFYRGLGGAPVAIIACTLKSNDAYQMTGNLMDLAGALENLLLAAVAEGLGACWMRGPLRPGTLWLQDYFKIPADREVVAIVPLGFPAYEPMMPPKIDFRQKVTWVGF